MVPSVHSETRGIADTAIKDLWEVHARAPPDHRVSARLLEETAPLIELRCSFSLMTALVSAGPQIIPLTMTYPSPFSAISGVTLESTHSIPATDMECFLPFDMASSRTFLESLMAPNDTLMSEQTCSLIPFHLLRRCYDATDEMLPLVDRFRFHEGDDQFEYVLDQSIHLLTCCVDRDILHM